jgi:pimeloyl-ACP methyl ester carboxylesterase
MLTPHCALLGSGPTILMLHGIGADHTMFGPQLEDFAAAGYRAVAWDMPGYGSSAPVEPYTFKALAQSCIGLIEALHARAEAPLVLLGHSMGGMVAQEVVARRPELVSHLILAGTSPAFGNPDAAWQQRFQAERTALLDAGGSMRQLAEKLIPTLIGAAAEPDGVALAGRAMARVPPSTYRRALQALVTFDRKSELARIGCPTLLIAGEQDRAAPPRVMRGMQQAIVGADYVELAGVGHLQNLEAPELFSRTVLAWLALPSALRHGAALH